MATHRAVPCRAERSTHPAHVLVLAVLLPSVCVDAACFDWCGEGDCGGGACCRWDDCCDCSECSAAACPPRPVPTQANMLSDSDLTTIRSHFQGVGPLSIAVVGSSGNVLHRGAGPDIDRARIVIRFNDADAAGYESDIGQGHPQRTTGLVRVCWAGGLAAAVRRNVIADGELIIMVPDPEEHEDGSRARHPSVVVKHEWVDALHASMLSRQGLSPSTGFIGLCLAMAIAQDMQGSVHAYGFGACPRCGKYDACVIPTPTNGGSPDEARSAEANGGNAIHPFGLEATIRKEWASQGVLDLHEDDACGVCHSWPDFVPCAAPLPPAIPSPPPPPPSPLPPLLSCQQLLDQHCQSHCAQLDGAVIVARYATADGDAHRAWRCYALSGLGADRSEYVHGTAHCPLDGARALLGSCRGIINHSMVESGRTLLDLSPWTHIPLRYFCLVPRQNSSTLWLIARGGSATHDAVEESQYATFLLSTATRRRNPAIIMRDPSISRNMVVKLGPDNRYHAFGGHDLRPNGVLDKRRDGIYHLQADNFSQLQAEVWTNRPTNLALNIFNGQHTGCVTPRHSDGVCELDGKVGAAWLAGTWYVFVRANVKLHGGRYVYVTKSTDGPAGPYGDLKEISIEGYNLRGPGNINFAAVESNPVDPNGSLLGLFPVNEGIEDTGIGAGDDDHHDPGRSDGEAYIGLSLSCDGEHWSRLVKLVWSRGDEGYTYDEPVDGLIQRDGVFSFLVHSGVDHVAPESRLKEYVLRPHALSELTQSTRGKLTGCAPERVPLQQQPVNGTGATRSEGGQPVEAVGTGKPAESLNAILGVGAGISIISCGLLIVVRVRVAVARASIHAPEARKKRSHKRLVNSINDGLGISIGGGAGDDSNYGEGDGETVGDGDGDGESIAPKQTRALKKSQRRGEQNSKLLQKDRSLDDLRCGASL